MAKLRAALEKQTAQIDALTKQRDSLKGDITGLELAVTELSTVLTAYKEACKGLDQQKRDLDTYVKTKTPMLEAAVREHKQQIEQCIASVDKWIDEWRRHADHLKTLADASAKAAAAAEESATNEQTEYDALKNSAQRLGDKLKELKTLHDDMEKADDENKTAKMYVLLKELAAGLAEIRILTPQELEQALCVAWTELNQAKAAARDAKAASETAAQAHTEAVKKLNDAVAKRRDKILECIAKLCPEIPMPKGAKY